MMEQLVFADGFRLRFVDGKMDRSQLLLANQFKLSNSVLLAEGVIPLNEGETKSLLGDEAYYLERRYLLEAVEYGRQEPVTPWMGADSARHYQWYPFMNMGHAHLAA